MKMDLMKMLNNNLKYEKPEVKLENNNLFNKKLSSFKEQLNSIKENTDSLKNDDYKSKNVSSKDTEKKSTKDKDSEDSQVEEALQFLNSFMTNSEVSDDNLNNKDTLDKSLIDLSEIINKISNLDINKIPKLMLNGKCTKEDLSNEVKVLKTLNNITDEIKSLLNSNAQNISLNKNNLLKEIKNLSETLNIGNKDILALIQNSLKNLENSISKADLKKVLSKLNFTEKLIGNLVNEEVKVNPGVLNVQELSSLNKLINEDINVDKKDYVFKNIDITQKQSETKEEKLLNDIINGKDSKDKKPKINLLNTMITNKPSNEFQVDSVGATVKINPANPVDSVIKSVKYMNTNGLKELTVKINPIELGEMNIKLSMNAEGMKATISANNKDTYNLLNANLNDLKNSLNNQNIKVVEVFVNLNNENQGNFQNEFNQANLGNEFSNNQNSAKHNENNNREFTNESIDKLDNDLSNDDSLVNAFA